MEVDPLTSTEEPVETEVINQHAYDFVIQTVYEKCKKEKENKKLAFPLNSNEIRVSYYTGVPLSYVKSFYTSEVVEDVEFPIDISMRKKIYDFLKIRYESSTLPTLENMNEEIQSQLSAVDLQKMLSAMGFDYRKTTIGQLTLVENPDVAAERFKYLSKIIKFRKTNKTIYFVDEAYVSNQFEFLKFLPDTATSEDKELVDVYSFYYVVCKNGLVSALFCNKRDNEHFEQWFTGTILKALQPDSVVVLKRPYEPSNSVTRYTSKEDMIKMLKNNDVPYSSDMHKSQLYDLICKFRLKETHQNAFENLVKAHGHQTISLPRPLYDLSIGELALGLLKSTVDIRQNDSLFEIKNKVLNFFDNISPTLWTLFSSKIEKLERELYDTEVKTDRALEAIIG